MKPYRFGLTSAILSSLAALLVLTWVLLSFISFTTAENDLLAQKNEEGRRLLAAVLSVFPSSDEAPATGNSLQRVISKLSAEPSFAGILIVDANGRPLPALPQSTSTDPKLLNTLRTGRETHSFSGDRRLLHRYSPVLLDGAVIGAARLSLSLEHEQARLTRSRQLFLTYFLLDFLLLLALGYFIIKRIVITPIRNLLQATERLAAGDYGSVVHLSGSAEVADLARSFNDMVTALNRNKRDADAYVLSLQQANNDLKAAREESVRAEKMASVGLLAAGMAHEIGSPLAAVLGFAGILKDELAHDPEKADCLRRLENEAGRIDRIVRGLLDYARPSGGNVETLQPGPVVVSTLDLLNGHGALKGIDVALDIDEHLPAVAVDRHELQQVLINLLLNARDAMAEGGTIVLKVSSDMKAYNTTADGHDRQVLVRGRRRDDFHGAFLSPVVHDGERRWVTISVTDSGAGISQEHISRIFDPFFTTKPPGQGTGLGLAISARIVDSYGGRIIAESGEGTGTTFRVVLPAVRQEE